MVTQNTGNLMDLNPESFVEGGGPPVQQNLTIKEARFCHFDYDGKVAQKTVALRLILDTDDGTTHIQHYSVGDTQRWSPSQDGRAVQAIGAAKAGNKNSNFGILMTALVNAGFPKQMLGRDIGALDGVYAYWDGMPAPKRPGLTGQRENAIVLVPTKILRLPGQAGIPAFAQAPSMPTMPTMPTFTTPNPATGMTTMPAPAMPANGQVDYNGLSVALLNETAQAKSNVFSLQDLAMAAFSKHGQQPYRDQLVSYIMTNFPGQLATHGFQMDQQFRVTKR